MSFIFLSTPEGTHAPFSKQFHYARTAGIVEIAVKRGYKVFSPFVHNYSFLNVEPELLRSWRHSMLSKSSEVWVMMMGDNWEEDLNIKDDLKIASILQIPALFFTPDQLPDGEKYDDN